MMKQILTTIQEKTSKILSLAILAGTIASCDSVLRIVTSNIVSSSSMTTTWKKKTYLPSR